MTTLLYQFRVLNSHTLTLAVVQGCGQKGLGRQRTVKYIVFPVDCMSWQKLLITPPAMEKGGSVI